MFKAIYRTIVQLCNFMRAVVSLLLAVFVSLTVGLGLAVILGSLPKSEELGFSTTFDVDSITLVASSAFNVPWLVTGLFLAGSVWGIIVVREYSKPPRDRDGR